MTISRLLYLGFGTLILLFLISGFVAYRQIGEIAAAEAEKAEVTRPLQQAIQEMIIQSLQNVRGVVSYVERQDFEDLARTIDSQKGFESCFASLQKLAVTKELKDLTSQVKALYASYKASGDSIMTLADQRLSDHQILREYARSMGELVNEQLLQLQDQSEQDAARQKLQAATTIAVRIQEIHSIHEAYMTKRDPSLQQRLGEARQAVQQAFTAYREADPSPDASRALGQLADDFARVTAIGNRTIATTDDIQESLEQFRADVTKADRILHEKVQPRITQQVDAARERARRATELATTVIASCALVGLLFGGSLAVVIQRRVTRPLKDMAQAMEPVARGDLCRAAMAHSNDEPGLLAAAFNQMLGSLRDLLVETKTMTAEVTTASHEIATSTQQQVASLTESAAAINQITTVAEQFKATMQEFADRARAVQEAAEETGKRANEGRGLTRDSATRTERVRVNAQAAGDSVLALTDQMQRINEITAAVNEIAEQTKLLSLNASIEAARAGEEGRGFAVVATQVRELANQSKEAVRRIDATIAETHQTMQTVVAKIEEGGRLSEESSEIVKNVRGALEEIATAVFQTIEAMKQIAAGAKDQERGISDLANGIAQVDTGSSEALTAAQQTQQSIAEIDKRIRTLNDTMGKFKT
jgi:methyl-accepting chemotaxis protein